MKKMKEFARTSKFFSIDKNRKKNKKNPTLYDEACKIRESRRWRKLRPMAMAMFSGLCAYCFKSQADHVHHIKRLVDRPDLAFDLDNLAPLCEKCHSRLHARANLGEDAEGQLREKMEINLLKAKV
jgi:5-methylcytosine-specific restriction endonuclease McrA